jgi:prepilin-type N-terminal cleavage/methylation domain-containing protein
VSCGGFTLIEILLAISILVAVMAIGFAVFGTALTVSGPLEDKQRMWEMGRICLAQMTADLEAMMVPPAVAGRPVKHDTEEGADVFVAQYGSASQAPSLMRFAVRTADGAHPAGMVQVTYYTEDARTPYDGPLVLRRAERPYPFEVFAPRPDDPVICEQLEAWQVDLKGPSGNVWEPDTDPQKSPLPSAVGLTLKVRGAELAQTFRTRIALPLRETEASQ